ncbi:MAG: glycoside hydrolase family 30 protein [Chitinispirillaceae bacterium]|nr:glycoside hydrolase family 30 protein [Chitinispirillaceae bacterium]
MNRVSEAISTICLLLYIVANGAGQLYGGALPNLVISSEDGYWQTGTFTKVTGEAADITIDESVKYQLWEGFGGTFNEAGWDALSEVSSEIPTALRLLFDADDGANFVYGRIPIGASDYAMDWYTLAETPNDYAMEHFSIARDREKLIPYIKAALEVKPDLHLWGSPWVCPGWMKDGMNFRDNPQTLEAYALYFAKFVEEYGKEGLAIEAIHHQNEPGYSQVKWTIPLFVKFLRDYLGPMFDDRNIEAEIWCGTMSHPDDADIAIACMNDDEAMQYIVGFGLQWNLESAVPTLSQKGRVWQTEHRCGNYNFETKYWDIGRYNANKPQNDHLYGEESWQLMRDWIAAGVNSYSAWNMILDTYGKSLGNWPQNALLLVDRSAKKLIVTPAYWVFRHFSQYIAPGATRIEAVGSIDALAFMNPDGRIITQVLNKEDTSQTMTVSVTGTLYRFDLPAHGWATLSVHPTIVANGGTRKKVPGGLKLRITHTGENWKILLPSTEAGRIELLTVSGQVLESRVIPQGCREMLFRKQTSPTGCVIVRVVYGDAAETEQLFSIR